MATILFVLGAGASKDAGAPLMAEFLDVAHDLWKSNVFKVKEVEEKFQYVFNSIALLQQVHSKSQLDIHNVESVFAAFEMAGTLNKFGNYTKDQINMLLAAMKTVIVATIEDKVTLPVSGQNVRPPPPYEHFTSLLSFLRSEAEPKQSVAVLTFNYDIAADFAFYKARINPIYGLEEGNSSNGIPLLKLHGSLNWAQCKKCGAVVPWKLNEYFSKYRWDLWPGDEPRHVRLAIGSHISSYEHCGEAVSSEPFVVPPTWNKTDYHRILSPVWSKAAYEMGEAENIFVIGYSLPLSDAFFRYLYALGSVGGSILKRFWVFNPDKSGDVERRFLELLGPGAKERFKYSPTTFNNALGEIKSLFPKKS